MPHKTKAQPKKGVSPDTNQSRRPRGKDILKKALIGVAKRARKVNP